MKEAEKEIAREYYKELIARENVTLALVSSIVAIIPAFLSIFFLMQGGKIPIMLFVLPGIIIGFCAKFGGGKAFRPWVKSIPAIVTLLVMLVSWLLLPLSHWFLILAGPSAVFAYIIGKPSLTERQKLAYYRVKRGLVDL